MSASGMITTGPWRCFDWTRFLFGASLVDIASDGRRTDERDARMDG